MPDCACLGGVRFVQMAGRRGLAISHIPMRMQDVHAGSGGIPLGDRSWQRRACRVHELRRWSARPGVPVNIEPRFFPADIDLASCMVIAAQRQGVPAAGLVNAAMRAAWAEDLDLADPAVLAALASRLGLDGPSLLSDARTDDVRAEYAGNTARALSAGVFGSPFHVFSGEVFWGQDRLDMLGEAIIRQRSGDLGRRPV